MDRHLHIVSLDIPFPAAYGGIIEIFYKIKALHQIGVKIHLHCFAKEIKMQTELENYCESVQYYRRKKNLSGFSFTLPYIVQSRSNQELIENLKKDHYPILLEGIHSTYLLNDKSFAKRNMWVRLHNAENIYYRHLAKYESNLFKKAYFIHEAKLLEKYEKAISKKTAFIAMSSEDANYYKNKLEASVVETIPAFVPFEKVTSLEGNGNYCLYHGNLSINENEEAALWIVDLAKKLPEITFKIAGRNPGKKLFDQVKEIKNCLIISNPSDEAMQDLIANAQINILPSLNNTGIKLKLLNALYNGRHCLVNRETASGGQLESLCVVATDLNSMKNVISGLIEKPFTKEMIEQREIKLKSIYNNMANAKKLITLFD